LRLPGLWAAAPALLMPSGGQVLAMYLNGQIIPTQGLRPPALERQFYVPRYHLLPEGLWLAHQNNEVLLLIQSRSGFRAGVSDVFAGPPDLLEARWQRQAWSQEAATLSTGLLGIALGLFVLLRWSRQQNLHEFAWFGLIFVIWGLRTLQLGLSQVPLPEGAWLMVRSLAGTWSAVLFALFCLMLSRSEDPAYRAPRWVERALWAYGLAITLLVPLVPTDWIEGPQMRWAHLVGVLMTLWGQWRVYALAFKLRRLELWLPAGLVAFYIGLALVEYLAGPDRYPFPEHLAHQYESAPLFLSAGWLLAQRYWRALGQARSLAETLQDQVDEQRQALERNFEQLKEAEREQARTQERARLMRDLHDGLGLHLVSALRQAKAEVAPKAALIATLQDGLDELRVAIDSLDTSQRDPLTLLGTLRFRMAPRFEALGLKLGWSVDADLPDGPELSPAAALQLLRIVQEALGNALKHSGATQVTINLQAHEGGCRICVMDNGRGFDVAQAPSGRGLGHMKARAQALQAQCTIRSHSQGTTVLIDLPKRQDLPPPSAWLITA
jgi:signal transduction histidine kinase